MPYSGPDDKSLPDTVKKLPKWLRNVFAGAFNGVMESDDGDEAKAFPIAWAAVRRAADAKGKKKMTTDGRPQTTEQSAPVRIGLKVISQADGRKRWLSVSSGGYQDREREIVSTAFLEDAIERAEKMNDRGDLRIYHIPGSRIGGCDYQAVSDGFLLESGLFDDSRAGKAGAAFVEAHPETKISIGFAYRHRTADGVYIPPGIILERSILPPDAAAFPWATISLTEHDDMTTITEAKRKALDDILGEEVAGEVLTGLEAAAKNLQESGVRFKEMTDDGGQLTAEVDEAVTEAVAPADEPVAELAAEVAPVAAIEGAVSAGGGGGVAQAQPEQLMDMDFELSEQALDDIASRLWGRIEGLMTKSITPLVDQVGELRTVTKAMSADVARLSETEDARIAEKAADLPRATVRRILRPTQRSEKALEELEKPQGANGNYLDIGLRTLHGD